MAPKIKSVNPGTVWPVPEAFSRIYSHAIEVSNSQRLLFVSGQVGVAADGGLPADFRGQATNALANVEALVTSVGMARTDIVKLTYLLTRTSDLAELGELRRLKWSDATPPAVTVMVVAALARPEFLIEIEAVAAA